ncbi:MAG: hypothetical protein IPG96_03230 [Proteobacteria bacterium]|nr:hypothetical protein [Pseudomonadota bacterium]
MRMRRLPPFCAGLCLAGFLLAAPVAAEARLLEFWGSGLVGAATGNGKTGRDFYRWAGGPAGGFEVGARLLFISAYLDYLRFFDGDANAHLVGLNLGGDGSIDLGHGLGVVMRLSGTFYLGSLDAQTHDFDGKLVDSQRVNTRGVGGRGGIGLRYSFWRVLSLGVTPQLGYHYFFGGADEDPTETELNSAGWDFQALGYLRVAIGI